MKLFVAIVRPSYVIFGSRSLEIFPGFSLVNTVLVLLFEIDHTDDFLDFDSFIIGFSIGLSSGLIIYESFALESSGTFGILKQENHFDNFLIFFDEFFEVWGSCPGMKVEFISNFLFAVSVTPAMKSE